MKTLGEIQETISQLQEVAQKNILRCLETTLAQGAYSALPAGIQDAIPELSKADKAALIDWLKTYLDARELTEQVIRLTQSYVIWWEISNRKNVKRYAEVLQEYLDFFEPIAHIMLWQGFFVLCYQLFDEHQDSKHIKSRIDRLAQTDFGLAANMTKQIQNYAVLKKIRTIRHKVSAHRDRQRSPQQVISDNAILAKELEPLVVFVQDIVSTLVEALGAEKKSIVMQRISACQASTRNHAFQVLQVLAKSLRDAPSTGLTLGD